MKNSTKAKLLCSAIIISGGATSIPALAMDLGNETNNEATIRELSNHNNAIVDVEKIASMPMNQ